MVIRKAGADTDQISRSLLQKAVRRGACEVVDKTIQHLISNNDFDWLQKRLGVMTFEECWQYGLLVGYENNENTIRQHYLALAKTVKNKNAAGLGALAYELSEGDHSVLDYISDAQPVKIISEAINRPKEFWEWAQKQSVNKDNSSIVRNADKGYRKAGWPWDKAFAQAAAYLSITTQPLPIQFLDLPTDQPFPYWVGIDKHTPEGKSAIREAARELGVKSDTALWLAFYFESAKCNEISDSPWWESEKQWRMQKLNLDICSGSELWLKLKPVVKALLHIEEQELRCKILNPTKSESTQLQTDLFDS